MNKYDEILEMNFHFEINVWNEYSKKLDFIIDKDYVDFLKQSNGGKLLSSNLYLEFWRLEDIIMLNPYYEDVDECKKLFFFGTDGSNLGYGFNKKTGYIVCIDFLEIGYSVPKILANNFKEFLDKLIIQK